MKIMKFPCFFSFFLCILFVVLVSKAHHLRPDTDTGRAARGLHGPHRGAVCRVSQRAVLDLFVYLEIK